MHLTFAQHRLQLLADRAVWWEQTRTLIVADLHLGKAGTFRAGGLPVPAGTTQHDLDRLSRLIQQTGAKRLLILGDLFHELPGMSHGLFARLLSWRDQHRTIELVLIRGNHDIRAGDGPDELRMACLNTLVEEGVLFMHHPPEDLTMPTLCGHIHPGAWLSDFDGSGVTVPCFVHQPNLLILPAFGRMTGCKRVEPQAERSLYLAAANRIVAIEARTSGSVPST